MAGIYVHIPFCKQACHYCDFHFSTNTNRAEDLVSSLAKEAENRKAYLTGESISTLYFGGGTPSILEASEIERLASSFQSTFDFEAQFEFTLEANPDDLSREKLQSLKSVGVNRLSVGIQSFLDDQLTWMNRAHNSLEASQCIRDAHEIGFDNISIDLIYGLPNLSLEAWKLELQKAIDLGIQHVSAYCLTVESKTALGHWVKKGKEKPIDEEAANAQFQIMIEVLAAAGFEQYEVSNFAFSGFESQHNRSYWQGIPYIGLGPSAHSFDGKNRGWNIANNAQYTTKISEGNTTLTEESLTPADRINEYVMTGLRTKWGVDFGHLKTQLHCNFEQEFHAKIKTLVETGMATKSDAKLRLTKKGLFFADGIASDFFILNHED